MGRPVVRFGLMPMQMFGLGVALLRSLTSLVAGFGGKLPDPGCSLLCALGQRLQMR